MISTTVLTIRPSDHTAGTAPKTKLVEVRPRRFEQAWVTVYDWETQYYKLMCVDASQVWFWTDKWQALEHEADDDLRHGHYEDFDSMDDFINSL
jgi:hypothetical protein